MAKPTLYIFAGMPGAGKTTLAQRLAADFNAVLLRIDTIEQAMRDLCEIQVEGEGYGLAYRVAVDNLRVGLSVVADSRISLVDCAASEDRHGGKFAGGVVQAAVRPFA